MLIDAVPSTMTWWMRAITTLCAGDTASPLARYRRSRIISHIGLDVSSGIVKRPSRYWHSSACVGGPPRSASVASCT